MSAELIVLEGLHSAESFIVAERATLGSDASCDVRLDAAGVAPFHAVLVRRPGGGYRLASATAGAELVHEGVSRSEVRLYHGQRVKLGTVTLQLLCAAERNPKDTSAEFLAESSPDAEAPIERVWSSDRYRTTILDRKELEGLDKHDRLLRSLYVVGNAATAERSLARLLERASDAVEAALRPDRLVVALYEPAADRLVSAIVRRGARDDKGARLSVSRSIVRRGAVDGVSVVTRARRAGETGERPILCAPLSARARPVGAFYLERLPDGRSFADDELDFLGAVGRIVGLAVERARFEADARARAEERDRERSRWHAVAQGLLAGVIIVDARGRVEMANPTARQILSRRLGVDDPASLERLGDVTLASLVASAEQGEALEIVAGKGRDVFLEVRPSPVRDASGQRTGAALLVTDATEERLRQAKRVQAEKLSTLGELLAGVAHEINNPLATILGYAEMLAGRAPPEQKAGLEAILEEAERCRRVVSSLLAFARPGRVDRAALDVGQVASSVLDLLGHELKGAEIAVSRELPPTPSVLADRYELQQVFFNLVKNGIDAVKSTGRPGKLTVAALARTSAAGKHLVRVEIRDSGPGLPPEAQGVLSPRPFFTTKGDSGNGLGLSIAHGIVQSLGGTIEASRALEGGALLAVELPAASSAELAAAPGGAVVAPESPGERGRKILIVDDEGHVRDMLAQIVAELGHVPILAANGADALRRIEAEPSLEAVLSDIRMPTMGGIELLRELRARNHPLADRLVFLSGDLARPETAEFLHGAGRPVLPKPFRLAQVCRAIESVLASPA